MRVGEMRVGEMRRHRLNTELPVLTIRAQANGLDERMNQTLKFQLQKLVNDQMND